MRRTLCLIAAIALLGEAGAAADIPKDLETRMDALSATLDEEGAGWSGYAGLMHPGYARWAMGELYQGREAFLESLKEWWDYGMRVKSRESEIVGADITGDIAIIRMTTKETFIGPDGDSGGFEGHVVNVWLREKGEWMLLSADIAPASAAL